MQVGYYPFICPTCGETHRADLFTEDLKNGYVVGECYRSGSHFDVVLDLPEKNEPTEGVLVNGLNRNYPDGFAGVD